MPVTVNLRLLKEEESAELAGELPVEEFGADLHDILMRFDAPLRYALTVEPQEGGISVQGTLGTRLACECARCLKPFPLDIRIDPFAAYAPLAGEDALVCEGDFGDLTPLLREDIYLALPTNPLCRPECRGLPAKASARDSHLEGEPSDGPSPWGALDQLKL